MPYLMTLRGAGEPCVGILGIGDRTRPGLWLRSVRLHHHLKLKVARPVQ